MILFKGTNSTFYFCFQLWFVTAGYSAMSCRQVCDSITHLANYHYCTFEFSVCAKLAEMALLSPANEVCESYVFTPVCQSFCSKGGVPGQVPPGQSPPGQASPGQVPSMGRYTPWAGTPPRQVHPLPGTPLGTWALGPLGPWAGTPRQVHPTGQYASYWNAFLMYSKDLTRAKISGTRPNARDYYWFRSPMSNHLS